VVYGMPKAARGYERLPWEHPEFGCRALPVACENPQFRLQKTICRASKASDRHLLFYKERDIWAQPGMCNNYLLGAVGCGKPEH
jgi:hypothetical protein